MRFQAMSVPCSDATQIHERAVVGDVLDHAVEHLALRQGAHQARTVLGAGLFHDGAARHDDVAAATVHLEDRELLGLAHQRADVAHRAHVDLAARQEGHGARQVDREATLHAAEDRAHDAFLIGERLLEDGPGLFAASLVARQDGFAFLVLHAVDEDVDGVAFLDLGGTGAAVGELTQRDATLGLEADIHHDEIICDANDAALDDRAFEARRTAQRFFEECGELGACGVVRAGTQGAALSHTDSPSSIPGETLPPVGQPVKSGGSTAFETPTQGRHVPAQSPLEVFDPPAATYGPEDRKPLRSMNAKAAAKAASASMSLVSRW